MNLCCLSTLSLVAWKCLEAKEKEMKNLFRVVTQKANSRYLIYLQPNGGAATKEIIECYISKGEGGGGC